MVAALFAGIGAVWGFLFARANGRKRLGCVTYAAGFAVAFALLGALLVIVLDRFLPPL